MVLWVQPGWKCRSCPRDDVPWVGLPSVHGWHPAEQPRPVWQCRQHWLPPSPARPVLHQPARRALRSPLPGAPAGRPSGRPAAHLGDAVGAGLSTLPGVLGPWGDRARRRVRMGCVCPRAEPKLGTASQAWGGGGREIALKLHPAGIALSGLTPPAPRWAPGRVWRDLARVGGPSPLRGWC